MTNYLVYVTTDKKGKPTLALHREKYRCHVGTKVMEVRADMPPSSLMVVTAAGMLEYKLTQCGCIKGQNE